MDSPLIDAAAHPLTHGAHPVWADGVGEDAFGPFAELWFDYEGRECLQRLRWIRPGTLQMGSTQHEEEAFNRERPQHSVTLTQGYWLFDTPVTQALWAAVMGETPARFDGEDNPVERVSWQDCQAFLQRFNERRDGLTLTLPTEAQWEYACRAGSTAQRYGDLGKIAWYSRNGDGKTHPVGQLLPNGWGLFDMLGNVWEWCADRYGKYPAEHVQDPAGASAGDHRVVRGGSWIDYARFVRCASRYGYHPSNRSDDLGFRCARVQV